MPHLKQVDTKRVPDLRYYGDKAHQCPKFDLHVMPYDIVWSERTYGASENYTQRRCPGCGFWRVWEPKR